MKVEVNAIINKLYVEHLRDINKKLKARHTCEDVTLKLGKSFLGLNYNPLKNMLIEEPSLEVYPNDLKERSKRETYDGTIYESMSKKSLYFKAVPLDPALNMGGIYISFDKFVHFQGSGYVYFKKYLKALKRGKTEEEAMQKSIDWGIFMEKTILGLKGSGVLSFGDLEANFQGMMMYKDFCESSNPFIAKNEKGDWEMVRTIDITDYITPHMDEVFNPSFHKPSRWKKYIRKDLVKNCSRLESPIHQERMKLYRSYPKSFNKKYLESLQEKGKLYLNKEHSLESNCH